MRPWLQKMLEDGDCVQISWINKREKTFKMAWKHAAGQNWDRGQDCNLFEMWARHTGKYYDGDKPDHKRWKANFRCALNSLLDVEELKNWGVKRGNNAYKVYRFLDEKRERKTPKVIKEESMDDEEEFIVKSHGTRSRPRRPVADLDSEGSELGTTDQDDYSDNDFREFQNVPVVKTETSPLPHFDQICPFTFSDLKSSLNPATRFPEASSPQTHTSTSSSDDDNQSSISSAPTDEEVISLIQEIEGEEEEQVMDFWQNYPFMLDITVQEGPEQVLAEDGETVLSDLVAGVVDNDGPNVLVESETDNTDYSYTSIMSAL